MTARLVYRISDQHRNAHSHRVCTLLAVSVLFFILGYLLWHGDRALTWDFFTKLPVPVANAAEGMANANCRSGRKLLLIAFLIGVQVGFLGGGLFGASLGEAPSPTIVRYTNGPAERGALQIVIGIFAYTVNHWSRQHQFFFSTFAAAFATGVMNDPIAVRSHRRVFFKAVPKLAP